MHVPMLRVVVSLVLLALCFGEELDPFEEMIQQPHLVELFQEKWRRWKERHEKTYSDPMERALRFRCYSINRLAKEKLMMEATAHNDDTIFHMGSDPYADLCPEEYEKEVASLKIDAADIEEEAVEVDIKFDEQSLPKSVDNRQRAQPVQNQGRTNACWSFCTTAALEIQQARTGTPIKLAEQELVDCSGAGTSKSGGSTRRAAKFVVSNNGMSSEAAYGQFTFKDGVCRARKPTVAARGMHAARGEAAMQQAIYDYGALAICLDATPLRAYSQGIFRTCPEAQGSKKINHGVTMLGYGEENGLKFWIIRNSYGTKWGENGYLRLIRGQKCIGITTVPGFVALATSVDAQQETSSDDSDYCARIDRSFCSLTFSQKKCPTLCNHVPKHTEPAKVTPTTPTTRYVPPPKKTTEKKPEIPESAEPAACKTYKKYCYSSRVRSQCPVTCKPASRDTKPTKPTAKKEKYENDKSNDLCTQFDSSYCTVDTFKQKCPSVCKESSDVPKKTTAKKQEVPEYADPVICKQYKDFCSNSNVRTHCPVMCKQSRQPTTPKETPRNTEPQECKLAKPSRCYYSSWRAKCPMTCKQ